MAPLSSERRSRWPQCHGRWCDRIHPPTSTCHTQRSAPLLRLAGRPGNRETLGVPCKDRNTCAADDLMCSGDAAKRPLARTGWHTCELRARGLSAQNETKPHMQRTTKDAGKASVLRSTSSLLQRAIRFVVNRGLFLRRHGQTSMHRCCRVVASGGRRAPSLCWMTMGCSAMTMGCSASPRLRVHVSPSSSSVHGSGRRLSIGVLCSSIEREPARNCAICVSFCFLWALWCAC